MTRVPIVEGTPDIARLVQRSLLLKALKVDGAAAGQTSSPTARDGPPGHIVLDRMLRNVDGVEV